MKSKYIETPEKMWELFVDYADKTKSRTRRIPKATIRGVIYEDHVPPLTIEGFKNYCADMIGDINRYIYNVDDAFSDYVSIITRIKEEIRQDQIEGSMVGQYNSNLTARLNGLVDKKEVTEKGEPRVFQVIKKGSLE